MAVESKETGYSGMMNVASAPVPGVETVAFVDRRRLSLQLRLGGEWFTKERIGAARSFHSRYVPKTLADRTTKVL
ncbi:MULTISPECIES: hypothetical protein [unclassified Rhizobium]|uniref:hypothetical protein n=1 Tax=unclassified Rhizobium TaxID=2613769 RepID=UPI00381609AF